MPPRDHRHAIDDMLAAIDGIVAETAGKTFEDYRANWLLRHAVERAIEIISEASRLIPGHLRDLRQDIPWPKVRGIGNVLRHGYHSLSDRVIWGVVVDELPRLREALQIIRAAADDAD